VVWSFNIFRKKVYPKQAQFSQYVENLDENIYNKIQSKFNFHIHHTFKKIIKWKVVLDEEKIKLRINFTMN